MRARVGAGAALAAVAFFVVPAAAQPAPPLDLRGAVRFALDHDPTVLNRRAALAQNEATYAKNHAAEFPSLAATLQNQLSKGNGNSGGSFQQFGLSQASVFSQNLAQIGSNWTLYNGSLAQIQAQEAKRNVEAARFDEKRAEQQLASDVAAAWYNAVQQREAVRFADGDRTYQQQLLDAARAQERVGRVAGVDVLRAQVNELRSEATLTSSRAAAANAREALAQRIGAPPDTAFALPVDLPEPPPPTTPLAALIAQALDARSDIGSARAQVAVARLADAAIESDRRPQLTLSASLGNSESPTSGTASRFVPGFGLVAGNAVQRPGFWNLGATESFTLPVIDYGSRRAAHRAARAQLDAALAALASDESGVATDVRQALRGVQTANANLATQREGTRLGLESARIAQLQYRNGLISLTDAAAAQQSALSAANDLVAARVAYLNALVRLRTAVGTADALAVVDVGV
ncbi:transporter [Vulcanimicrobium alpinum]|uniref:Transporter n=1 Tax=Vulcanimicrobium alpinum TaxID=3016050 RepID=A0AAN1XVX8_UNVUL|nr:TolC family protein [Vulcanimicrobium alpinum]BDE05466.1 transporter [Vulcanimicrobium alpinum]